MSPFDPAKQMSDQKSVFLSYRRSASKYIARLLFLELRKRGYDVFFDFESIDSGTFERVILTEIGRRAHFILIISAETLEDCAKEGDWVLREYREALKLKRNIVPLLVELKADDIGNQLKGDLAELRKFNMARYVDDFHDASIDQLCDRFLRPPRFVDVDLSADPELAAAVSKITSEAVEAGEPKQEELDGEEWRNKAKLFLDRREWELSMDACNRALEIDPEDAIAYARRGFAYGQKGETEKWKSDIDRSLEIDAKCSYAYMSRGGYYLERGDLERALNDYDRSVKLDPGSASGYQGRAVVFLRKNDLERAKAEVDRSLEIDPEIPGPYSIRGAYYFEKRQYDLAMTDFDRVLEIVPNDLHALTYRGTIHTRKENFESALQDYSRGLEIASDDPMLLNARGWVYFKLKRYAEARADYEKALVLDPDFQLAKANLKELDSVATTSSGLAKAVNKIFRKKK